MGSVALDPSVGRVLKDVYDLCNTAGSPLARGFVPLVLLVCDSAALVPSDWLSAEQVQP